MEVCVTICFHKTIDIDIQDTKNQFEVSMKASDAVKDMEMFMFNNGWSEDEFDATIE